MCRVAVLDAQDQLGLVVAVEVGRSGFRRVILVQLLVDILELVRERDLQDVIGVVDRRGVHPTRVVGFPVRDHDFVVADEPGPLTGEWVVAVDGSRPRSRRGGCGMDLLLLARCH